jgi:SAM-dependent methyltransferase
MQSDNNLTFQDFADMLGTVPAQLADSVCDAIKRADFRYEKLTQAERDDVILRVLKRIDSGHLTKVGEHRKEIWERGWEENLDAFSSKGFALETLIPRFMRPEPTLRLRQDYVKAINPNFEFFFHDVVRRWLYTAYMADCDSVYEFGSGSAYNLVAIAELAPHLKLVGLDWAASAVSLANLIGENHKINLSGRKFDFFHPDPELSLGSGDAALTICALEQVGPRHEEFLDFLLLKRPSICVHMEPILDLYDPDNLVDSLAIRFHNFRHYLTGFLPRLNQMQADGKIELLKVCRLGFGSLFHEGYSIVVWRPL